MAQPSGILSFIGDRVYESFFADRRTYTVRVNFFCFFVSWGSRAEFLKISLSPPITVLPLSEQRARPPTRPSTPSTSRIRPGDSNPPNASSSHTINKGDPAPQDPISAAQDSRRRSAEHRAATLRSDPLLTNVEPNRVFCTMCQKWVQLRQDSTFCAYPWLQHRGKCLAKQ